MLVFKDYQSYSHFREQLDTKESLGFVPTMGALHSGHLHLVEQSMQACDHTVVSIYVNARQFNDIEDFKKYPRYPEKDLELLEKKGVTAVFLPSSEEELYQTEQNPNLLFDLKGVDNVMEGAHRPGHFKSVVEVVERLFSVVKPSHAFFGLKDFQQYTIISLFVEQNNLPVKVVGVPTVREKGGLALSSRNERLSDQEKEQAQQIYAILRQIKEAYLEAKVPIATIKEKAIEQLKSINSFGKLDYLNIVQQSDLQEITSPIKEPARVFIAVQVGPVRLIDNLSLNH